MKPHKMKPYTTIHTKEHGKIEFATSYEWFDFDRSNITLHREDGPAIEWADGGKEYWLNGKLHRADGPAKEWADGSKFYYRNGKLHREDGPAVEWADGNKSYWLNDKYLSKKEFNEKKRKSMNLFKRTLISILKYLLHKLEKKGD